MKKTIFCSLMLLISSSILADLKDRNASIRNVEYYFNTLENRINNLTGCDLSDYALKSSLNSYLSTDAASSIYATKNALNSYLLTDTASSTYATKGALNSYLLTDVASNTYATKNALNSYLLIDAASSTYATKDALNSYLLTDIASNTYATKDALNSYLLTDTASNTYATKDALNSYLLTDTASNTYATKDALNSYLLTDTASSTYATKGALNSYLLTDTASNTYATKNALNSYLLTDVASNTYATKDALNSYLSTDAASNTYLSKDVASSTYLSTANASSTYASKTEFNNLATTVANLQTSSGISIFQNGSAFHPIGEYYGGGIVFYISDTITVPDPNNAGSTITKGLHGLIAATVDDANNTLTTKPAWASLLETTNINTSEINGGRYNTTLLLQKDDGTGAKYPAAYRASKYTVSSAGYFYNDWYLPSCDELVLISQLQSTSFYNTKISGKSFWCSNEKDLDKAYFIGFTSTTTPTTLPGNIGKDTSNAIYIRPIRAF